MPQVIISRVARQDLQRLQDFLKTKNVLAAKKIADLFIKGIRQLETSPGIGRLVEYFPLEYHELVIEFGKSGYLMLYRHDKVTDNIVILKIRHQKEAEYRTY